MLHFDGYGQHDGKQIPRDEIIKKGLKHNATVNKTNCVLKRFNASPFTTQEALEYIIGDSIENMTLNSKEPKLEDFDLTQSKINRIGALKNIYFLNIITILLLTLFVVNNMRLNINIIYIVLFLYFILGIWSFNFNKNYTNTIEMIELYNAVLNQFRQEQDKIATILLRKKQAEEEERRIREELKKRKHLDYWNNILYDPSLSTVEKGQIFEQEMSKLFNQMGWEVQLTRSTKDGGVDIIIELNGEICLVQCKFWKNKIGVKDIRELWGIKDLYNAQRVIMLSFEGATQDGEDFAYKINEQKKAKKEWVYKIYDKHDIIRWYTMVNKG